MLNLVRMGRCLLGLILILSILIRASRNLLNWWAVLVIVVGTGSSFLKLNKVIVQCCLLGFCLFRDNGIWLNSGSISRGKLLELKIILLVLIWRLCILCVSKRKRCS